MSACTRTVCFVSKKAVQSQNRSRSHHNFRRLLSSNTTTFCMVGPPASGKGTYGKLLVQAFNQQQKGAPAAWLVTTSDVLRDLRDYSDKNTSKQHESKDTNNSHSKYDSEQVSKKIAAAMQRGELLDDTIVTQAMYNYLTKLGKKDDKEAAVAAAATATVTADAPVEQIMVLDGFPRTREQAEQASQWSLHNDRLQIDFAIHVDVPDEVCIQKTLGRRNCSKCGESFNVAHVHFENFIMPPTYCACGSVGSSLPSSLSGAAENTHDNKNATTRHDDTREIIVKRLADYHLHTEPVLEYYGERVLRFVPYHGITDMPQLIELVQANMPRKVNKQGSN